MVLQLLLFVVDSPLEVVARLAWTMENPGKQQYRSDASALFAIFLATRAKTNSGVDISGICTKGASIVPRHKFIANLLNESHLHSSDQLTSVMALSAHVSHLASLAERQKNRKKMPARIPRGAVRLNFKFVRHREDNS